VVMGGAVGVPGNVTPTAEYNFYADPHAAQEVICAGARLTLIPLDVTCTVGLRDEDISRRVSPLKTARSAFFDAAASTVVDFGRRTGGYPGIHLHDPAAVAAAAAPQLFGTEPVWMDVETAGSLTRGQVVADRRTLVGDASRSGCRVTCATTTDASALVGWFINRALGGSDDA